MAEASDLVATAIDDGVLTVTINRPEQRNPLNFAVHRALRDVFTKWAENATVRAVILTGAGDKAFASGGDLKEFDALRDDEGARGMSDLGRSAFDAIRNFPVPTIARINGLALGGGAELSMACDMRFAAAHARIGFIQSQLAISTAWGGGVDVMALLGWSRGLRLLARAEVLDAQEAERIGLIDGVAGPDEDFDAAFEAFMEPICKHPPQVARALKSLAHTARMKSNLDRREKDALETQHLVNVWLHDDHWQAADAILNRKKK